MTMRTFGFIYCHLQARSLKTSRPCTRKTKRQAACLLIVFIMAISPLITCCLDDRARFRSPSPSLTAHSKTPTARARLGCKQPKHNRKRVLSGPCRRLHSAVDLTHALAFTIINPTHHTRTRVSYCYNILHRRTHAQATKAISKFTRSVRVAGIRGASIYIAMGNARAAKQGAGFTREARALLARGCCGAAA